MSRYAADNRVILSSDKRIVQERADTACSRTTEFISANASDKVSIALRFNAGITKCGM
jgi:hypothetical protein